MFRYADRTNTRPPSSMRNCKGFMQIEMAYIRPYFPRTGKAYLGIHIGSIHIDLSAVIMNKINDIHYIFIKETISGRISNHERRKIFPVLLYF